MTPLKPGKYSGSAFYCPECHRAGENRSTNTNPHTNTVRAVQSKPDSNEGQNGQ